MLIVACRCFSRNSDDDLDFSDKDCFSVVYRSYASFLVGGKYMSIPARWSLASKLAVLYTLSSLILLRCPRAMEVLIRWELSSWE